MMIIAADHPARGAVRAGHLAPAMGDRGVLGTPDILEDLLLLGVLDGKVVFGSMNRYLNVMAGPGERVWRFCDDPAHAWIRASWSGAAIDSRLPLAPAVAVPEATR